MIHIRLIVKRQDIYKKYTDGDIQCAALEEANFTGLLYRRKVGTDNQIMVDSKRFWRRVIVRHPIGGVSTTESRAEGLAVLRATFLSTELSDYPPQRYRNHRCY